MANFCIVCKKLHVFKCHLTEAARFESIVRERDAEIARLTKLTGPSIATPPPSNKSNGFDKKAYQRDYMRQRRAKVVGDGK